MAERFETHQLMAERIQDPKVETQLRQLLKLTDLSKLSSLRWVGRQWEPKAAYTRRSKTAHSTKPSWRLSWFHVGLFHDCLHVGFDPMAIAMYPEKILPGSKNSLDAHGRAI